MKGRERGREARANTCKLKAQILWIKYRVLDYEDCELRHIYKQTCGQSNQYEFWLYLWFRLKYTHTYIIIFLSGFRFNYCKIGKAHLHPFDLHAHRHCAMYSGDLLKRSTNKRADNKKKDSHVRTTGSVHFGTYRADESIRKCYIAISRSLPMNRVRLFVCCCAQCMKHRIENTNTCVYIR